MNELPKWRFRIAVGAMAAFAAVVLVHYMVLAGQGVAERSAAPRVPHSRGPIVDRNGRILAAEVRRYDIHVRRPRDRNADIEAQRIESLAEQLAPILDMDAREVAWRIATSK